MAAGVVMDERQAPRVWCVTPSHSGGWGPVTELATLVSRLWETSPTFIHPRREYSSPRKALAMLPRVGGSASPLLAIVSHPGDLLALANAAVLGGRFSAVAGWIIDSFWDDRLPLFARRGHILDRLWVTNAELVDRYAARTGLPTGWAPWGADALRLSRAALTERDVDVLRLGRQPAAWDDDATNGSMFGSLGIRYQGRFDGSTTDGIANQAAVHAQLSRTKLVLASGNLASPADYTHPSQEYLSARFTESIACGAAIVGQPPACRAADLLPEAGLIRVPVGRRDDALPAIREALCAWTPASAKGLTDHALRHLDWRTRIAAISRELGVSTPTLRREMADLAAATPSDPRGPR